MVPSSLLRLRTLPVSSALVLAALASVPAAAQTAPRPAAPAPAAPAAAPAPAPATPPVSAEPQQTTATFGDWVLRCSKMGTEPSSPRICEVVQTLQREGQQGIIAQIAIGRISPRDPLKLTVLLPVSIAIPGVVRMDIDDKDAAGGIDLGWRRCLPQGCVADGDAREDVLRKWRAQSGAGRLLFRDASNRDVSIQTSYKGLAQALDALAKS